MSLHRSGLALLLAAMASLACLCGSPDDPAQTTPPVTSPVVTPILLPTPYDAVRTLAVDWGIGSENEVPIGRAQGCTAREKAELSQAKAPSGKTYISVANFKTPGLKSTGKQQVRFLGVSFDSVAFNGTKFGAGAAACDPECCNGNGDCVPFVNGCELGWRRVENCTSDPGGWTDGAFEIVRDVTYQPQTAAVEAEHGEVLWTADSLEVVCRSVQTPMGSMRAVEWRVLGTVRALRLQAGKQGWDDFVPAYTLLDEVFAPTAK